MAAAAVVLDDSDGGDGHSNGDAEMVAGVAGWRGCWFSVSVCVVVVVIMLPCVVSMLDAAACRGGGSANKCWGCKG